MVLEYFLSDLNAKKETVIEGTTDGYNGMMGTELTRNAFCLNAGADTEVSRTSGPIPDVFLAMPVGYAMAAVPGPWDIKNQKAEDLLTEL